KQLTAVNRVRAARIDRTIVQPGHPASVHKLDLPDAIRKDDVIAVSMNRRGGICDVDIRPGLAAQSQHAGGNEQCGSHEPASLACATQRVCFHSPVYAGTRALSSPPRVL